MSHEEALAHTEMIKSLDDYAATVADRDNRIRAASASGMSKAEIASRMKISRTTVIAVLETDETHE
jgi:ribosome-binding protein aMBF1 (putative translation factor)